MQRREIKFRAWNKRIKIMFESFDLYKYGEWGKMLQGYGCIVYDDDSCIRWEDESDIIFMQCTGLKDKNGKEICEGDILSHQYKGKGQVIYEAPSFRVVGDDMDVWLGHCDRKKRKVVGNIYENKNLLK